MINLNMTHVRVVFKVTYEVPVTPLDDLLIMCCLTMWPIIGIVFNSLNCFAPCFIHKLVLSA